LRAQQESFSLNSRHVIYKRMARNARIIKLNLKCSISIQNCGFKIKLPLHKDNMAEFRSWTQAALVSLPDLLPPPRRYLCHRRSRWSLTSMSPIRTSNRPDHHSRYHEEARPRTARPFRVEVGAFGVLDRRAVYASSRVFALRTTRK
jgi:hypothetical protein